MFYNLFVSALVLILIISGLRISVNYAIIYEMQNERKNIKIWPWAIQIVL